MIKLDATDRFMRLHFTSRFNVQKDLYHDEIEKQKKYLLKILKIPDADPRDFLRRGDIVEKVRQKYRPKDAGGGVENN
jgi:hypothetical protein